MTVAPTPKLGGHVLHHLGVERLVDGDEDAAHQQGRDQVLGADLELFGQVLDADALGDGDLAGDGQRLIAEVCRSAITRRRHKALHRAFLGLGVLRTSAAASWRGALRARRFAGRRCAAGAGTCAAKSAGARWPPNPGRAPKPGRAPGAAGPPGPRSHPGCACRMLGARTAGELSRRRRRACAADSRPGRGARDCDRRSACRAECRRAERAGAGASRSDRMGALYTGRGPVCGITMRRTGAGGATGAHARPCGARLCCRRCGRRLLLAGTAASELRAACFHNRSGSLGTVQVLPTGAGERLRRRSCCGRSCDGGRGVAFRGATQRLARRRLARRRAAELRVPGAAGGLTTTATAGGATTTTGRVRQRAAEPWRPPDPPAGGWQWPAAAAERATMGGAGAAAEQSCAAPGGPVRRQPEARRRQPAARAWPRLPVRRAARAAPAHGAWRASSSSSFFLARMAFSTSPGLEICERSILGAIVWERAGRSCARMAR